MDLRPTPQHVPASPHQPLSSALTFGSVIHNNNNLATTVSLSSQPFQGSLSSLPLTSSHLDTPQHSLFHIFAQRYGDKDKDAVDRALMLLERGLRSKSVGERCESIMFFPLFFQRFPFASTITSAFLKLADFFLSGNNVLRLQIMQVTARSELQLSKISNLDEVIRRIFSVIHSNDPIARALTFRILSSFSELIPNRKDIHHIILSAMDSTDPAELHSGIFAAKKFARCSAIFSASVLPVITATLESMETPFAIKVKMLGIFENTLHDANTAQCTRQCAVHFLHQLPTLTISRKLLSLLTQISLRTLLYVPEQIDLLLRTSSIDVRFELRVHSLQCLSKLAKQLPHLWTTTQFDELLRNFDARESVIQENVLKISTNLIKSPYFTSRRLEFLSTVSNCLLNYSANVAATYIALYAECIQDTSGEDAITIARQCISLAMTLLVSGHTVDLLTKTPLLLGCVQICSQCHEFTPHVVNELFSYLSASVTNRDWDKQPQVIVQCLQSLVYLQPFDREIVLRLTSLISLLDSDTPALLMQSIIYLALTAIQRLRLADSTFSIDLTSFNESLHDKLKILLLNAISPDESLWWKLYKLVRRASLLGLYSTAHSLLSLITSRVSSAKNSSWLLALSQISLAESSFQDASQATNIVMHIDEACLHYREAQMILEATSSESAWAFQLQWIALRLGILQHTRCLYSAVSLVEFCDSPLDVFEIIASVLQSDQIIQQILNMKRSFLNIDELSLSQIRWIEYAHQLLLDKIHSWFSGQVSVSDIDVPGPVSSFNSEASVTYLQEFTHQLFHSSQAPYNIQCVSDAITLLEKFIALPFGLPIFYFQCEPSVQVQLSYSPSSSKSHPLLVDAGADLALQIDGLLINYSNLNHRRLVKACLDVRVYESLGDNTPWSSHPTEVNVKNGYFVGPIIVKCPNRPAGSAFAISTNCSFIDASGSAWDAVQDSTRLEVQVRQPTAKKPKPTKQ